MYKSNGLDRESLQTQLENCKLITEVNKELVDNNLYTKVELPRKLELAQNYINVSRQWQELGEHAKSHDSLTTATIILVEISAVIKHILSQEPSLEESDFQLGQSSA